MGSRVSMNPIIFWNFRGLGNPSTINALHSLVRKFSPDVLFLSKTKSNASAIRKIQNKLQFAKSVCVEAKGRAGGLDLFWVEEVEVQILGMEDHYIDAQVRDDSGRSWRVSCVYGWADSGQKSKTWALVNTLGRHNINPWIIGGDFNEVLQETEKWGGRGL